MTSAGGTESPSRPITTFPSHIGALVVNELQVMLEVVRRVFQRVEQCHRAALGVNALSRENAFTRRAQDAKDLLAHQVDHLGSLEGGLLVVMQSLDESVFRPTPAASDCLPRSAGGFDRQTPCRHRRRESPPAESDHLPTFAPGSGTVSRSSSVRFRIACAILSAPAS